MKKQKQIKVSMLVLSMMVILSIGCSKDDDTQPQTETPEEETPTAEDNKAPEISAQTFTAKEDIADDAVIGSIVATDPEGKSLTYILTRNSADLFELTDGGDLSLVADKKLDFETVTSHMLTIEVSDGKNKTSADITVTVENVVEPFITTWETTIANEEIIYQLNDELTYNLTIDWGDGTTDTNITSTPKHTYTESGIHIVSVSGVLPAVLFKDQSGGGEERNVAKALTSNASKLRTIEAWGDNVWESFEEAFFFCENMTYNAKDIPILSKVTELGSMFYGCNKFNGNINNWDVSKVTNMRNMFSNASSFNRDLDQWDVSNVTDMSQMFNRATSFNGNISTWDVSKVERMRFMFAYATSFNGDISNWNVSKVTTMSTMFSDATSFNGDISKWDVSNVTDMIAMFNGATSFNGVISNWNVGKVMNMRIMFANCTKFNSDISNWNVGNVTNMARMFAHATSFNGNISEWDISKVKYMSSMLDYTNLSTTNYDAVLTKWAALPNLQDNVFLGVQGLTYCDATSGRSSLINDKKWTITGDTSCPR